MKLVKEFWKNGKENGNYGTIIENVYAGIKTYIASVQVESKSFKTIKGAEKFINKYNYLEVQ